VCACACWCMRAFVRETRSATRFVYLLCVCVCGYCVCVCGCRLVDTRTIIEYVSNCCVGVKHVHNYIYKARKKMWSKYMHTWSRSKYISLYVRIRRHVGILHTHIIHSNVNIPKCKCNVPTCTRKREFVCEVCVCSTLCVCVYRVSVCVYDVCVWCVCVIHLVCHCMTCVCMTCVWSVCVVHSLFACIV